MSLKDALAEPEKNIIRQALEANHWNRQETAKALQINRTTLFKKMKHYGLYAEAEKLGIIFTDIKRYSDNSILKDKDLLKIATFLP